MKKAVFLFLLASSAHAQMHLTPTDPRIDLSKVPGHVVIDKTPTKVTYLTPDQRDVILERLFSTDIKNFDDVDRDILYKSIIHYSPEKLFKKYNFINKQNYSKVRDAFK